MEILWERGSATTAEVRDALDDDLAYNTVLTTLQRLEKKGYLRHEEEGRAHRYFPLVEREQVRGTALNRLLDRIFGGSADALLAHLISERRLTRTQIRRIQRVLEERLRDDDEEP